MLPSCAVNFALAQFATSPWHVVQVSEKLAAEWFGSVADVNSVW